MRMNCGDKIMIPCEECIALPICINKYKIKCNILKEWLYGDQMLFGINFMDVATTIFRKNNKRNITIEYLKHIQMFFFYDDKVMTGLQYHGYDRIQLRDVINRDGVFGGNENGI